MFTARVGEWRAGRHGAARAQEVFVWIVTRVVVEDHAWSYAGLLLGSAHGIADLELSGLLDHDKWPRAEALVDLLLKRLPLWKGGTAGEADERRHSQ